MWQCITLSFPWFRVFSLNVLFGLVCQVLAYSCRVMGMLSIFYAVLIGSFGFGYWDVLARQVIANESLGFKVASEMF